MKVCIISPDTVPLPLKDNPPEFITENGQEYLLKNKCLRTTGLGKRAWKLAEALSKENDFEVTLFVPDINTPKVEFIDSSKLTFDIEIYSFRAAAWGWSEELDKKLLKHDFVIVQSATGAGFKNCSVLPGNINVIVDGFVPLFAELPCTILGKSTIARKVFWESFRQQYLNLMTRANCVLYATDRQYYYYEGQFFAIDKLNWKAFKFSPLLKVPLGVDAVEKVHKENTSTRLKLLWFGPIYPWYRPEKLLEISPDLKNTDIDFVGVKHPRYGNTYNNFFKKFFESNASSYNITVSEDFVDDPASLYTHYDAGIVLARDWLEEKYSVRGRILDMISHGLPVIINENNSFFNELRYIQDSIYPTSAHTLKRDIQRFETNKSLLTVSDRSHKLLQKNLAWSAVASPLIEYIRRFSLDELEDENKFNQKDGVYSQTKDSDAMRLKNFNTKNEITI